MNLTQMTQAILQKMPAARIPSLEEGQLISAQRAFFQKHEASLINEFYNLLYSDSNTRLVLGEPKLRVQREKTLHQWYQVTISGSFDEDYWAWQTLVGIVHVKHKVSNVSLLSMWAWMVDFLQTRLLAELPLEQARPIISVLNKLQATVCSLIVESFLMTQQEAITRASGLNERILGRFINVEIDSLLKQGRESLIQAQGLQSSAA
ncbi:protoglobin domain-containing protein [uncultured Thiothrix sp.]|uniref:protoglobin domain-containing protein n=1 Tax=uncultured Thiothrix sp. TaxID=223185 RepID=UPI0026321317|nr:protoglobin domain-containing protein [uncultured Thiothrix sp.]